MKKTNETQTIPELALEVKGKEVFFTIDGEQRFKMLAENFLKAINSNYMGELAQAAATPEEDFSELGIPMSLYICTYRLLRKGLSVGQIAKLNNIDEPRLRKFYNRALQQFKINDPAIHQELERQEKESHDFCRCLQPRSDLVAPEFMQGADDFRFLELNEIRQLQAKEMEPGEIAQKLRLDKGSFEDWLMANQAYIDVL